MGKIERDIIRMIVTVVKYLNAIRLATTTTITTNENKRDDKVKYLQRSFFQTIFRYSAKNMTDNDENDNIWSAVIINKSKIIKEFIPVSFFRYLHSNLISALPDRVFASQNSLRIL